MKKQELKILVAVPCFDKIDAQFVQCLTHLEKLGTTDVELLAGSLVYDAREKLAHKAVDEEYTHILWLDSDMVFDENLLKDFLLTGKDFVSGLFFRRKPPYAPVLYKKLRPGLPGQAEIEDFDDYPEQQLFEIEGCGFGAVLMSTQVVKDVFETCGCGFIPIPGYGEDVSFCIRARKCGYKIFCDSRLVVGHIAQTIVAESTWKALQTKK